VKHAVDVQQDAGHGASLRALRAASESRCRRCGERVRGHRVPRAREVL
jgi:hypothetical protein